MESKPVIVSPRYCGVDIAKHRFVAAYGKLSWERENRENGFANLLENLPPEVTLVVEGTGGYEADLIAYALAHERPICLVNACRVRRLAEAHGRLAKTDHIDAQMIAAYAEAVKPRPVELSYHQRQRLRELLSYRDDLIVQINGVRDRSEQARHPAVQESLMVILEALTAQMSKIEAEIDRTSADLLPQIERLTQIKGIGKVNALTALAFLPELGSLRDQEAASLAGLAPHNQDSGKQKGRAPIRGGRGQIRRKLYMAAVCAIRCNPILKAFYQGLIRRGKPTKVALTAVMRKLIVLMNKLLRFPQFQLA